MANHSDKLGTEKISSLLFRLSVPAMIGMFVMALYNIVDTLFVARGIGSNALAGVTFVLPLQMFIMSISLMIGIGASSIVSRRLGEKKIDLANKAFGNSTIIAVFFGLILTILCLFSGDFILKILGVPTEAYSYSYDYFKIIIFGFPLISYSSSANNIARSQGSAKVAMITMVVGAILNIILDPIAIFVLNLGTFGAGLATVISQLFSAIFLFGFFFTKKSVLHYNLHSLILDFKIIKETIAVGASSFIRQVSFSVMAVVLNKLLIITVGTYAVASLGILQRVHMLLFMPMFGIVQGLMPIAGYNYGAKNMHRVKQVFYLSLKVITLMSVVAYIILLFFIKPIIRVFSNDPEIISFAYSFNWWIIGALIFVGYQNCAGGIFQAFGYAKKSIVSTSLRQIILLIPLLLILPKFLGLIGIFLAFPISDVGSFILIWFMMRSVTKEFNSSIA